MLLWLGDFYRYFVNDYKRQFVGGAIKEFAGFKKK